MLAPKGVRAEEDICSTVLSSFFIESFLSIGCGNILDIRSTPLHTHTCIGPDCNRHLQTVTNHCRSAAAIAKPFVQLEVDLMWQIQSLYYYIITVV
jgi:hypothetical protein